MTEIIDEEYVVMLVYKKNCELCTKMDNMINSIIDDYPSVIYRKIDVIDIDKIIEDFNISYTPTVLLIDHGELFNYGTIYNHTIMLENDIRRMIGSPLKEGTKILSNGIINDIDDNDIIVHSVKSCVLFFSGTNDKKYIVIRQILQSISPWHEKQVFFGELDSESCVSMRKQFKIPKNQPSVVLIHDGDIINTLINCTDEKVYIQEIMHLVGKSQS